MINSPNNKYVFCCIFMISFSIAVLSNQLDNANASYQAMSQLWDDVNTKLTDVSAQAEKLLPESVGKSNVSDIMPVLVSLKQMAAATLIDFNIEMLIVIILPPHL